MAYDLVLDAALAQMEEVNGDDHVPSNPDCDSLDFVGRMEVMEAEGDYLDQKEEPKNYKMNGVYP